MEQIDKYVNVSNKWFRNKENKTMLDMYGSDSLLIHTLLLRNLTFRYEIQFSMNELGNQLNIKQTNNRMVNKIKATLNKINNNLIEIYKEDAIATKVSKFEYNKIYKANLKVDMPKDNYFKLYDKDLDRLLIQIANRNIDKFEISTYLMFLLSCMGNKKEADNYRVCYPSTEHSAKICNILEGNVLRYNKILEECKIIAIDNAGMNKDDNNNFKNVTNTYARYEDKEILKQYVSKQREKISIAIDYSDKQSLQNKSRSKAKEISIWKKKHNIYNLTEEEYNELYKLEKEHYDIRYMICESKICINGGYVTLYPKKQGTKKDYSNYIKYIKEEE